MGNTDSINSWDKIQQGVLETERLIGRKQYNMAMIKARQTLEYMVKCLGERACIVEGDLIDNIDELYQGHWINKATYEHYHKIRTIGNKAVHEGDNNAYDANQAFHLLSQELYTFANEYSGKKHTASRNSATKAGSSRSSSQQSRRPSHPSSHNQTRSRKRKKKRNRFTTYDLLKIIIAILIVVLIVVLVKFIVPPKSEKETKAPTTTVEATVPETAETPAPETAAPVETTTAVYKTSSRLKVRSSNSTDSEVLDILDSGVTVEYIKAYDEEWALIRYDGREAYVASKYLSKQ